MRKILAILITVVIASSAMAAYSPVVVGVATNISINLTIPQYAQVIYQDDSYAYPPTAAPDIQFSGTSGVDWYNTTLSGAYYHVTDLAMDPWACNYWESSDGATIYVKANCSMTCTITTSGNLVGATTSHEIPTWFTLSATGYNECLGIADPNGFFNGGTYVNTGAIPFASSPGGYAGNGNGAFDDLAGGGAFFLSNACAAYPQQDVFQMGAVAAPNTWTIALGAPVGPGTLKFLARIKRSSTKDLADAYSATITPTFTCP
jgi:hypothetical protein